MALHSIPEILAAAAGRKPWYDLWQSAIQHLKTHDDAIGNLEVGAAPGQFAPYDTRFWVTESGFASNAYTAALSPVATDQALPNGYRIFFLPTNGNTGAATLDVGSTDGAVAIKKFESGSKADLASGDLIAGKWVLMVFDGTHWVADIVGASDRSISKSADYTLQDADVPQNGFLELRIGINGQSVDIDEYAAVGSHKPCRIRYVVSDDDGAGETYVANLYASDGTTLIWQGCRKGDHIEVSYDGAGRIIGPHKNSHYVRVRLPSDQVIAQGSGAKLTGWTELSDVGGLWDAATNHQLDIPSGLNARLSLHAHAVSSARGTNITAKIGTTYLFDNSDQNASNPGDYNNRTLSGVFDIGGGSKLELWGQNLDTDSGNATINGNATKIETFATIKIDWRYE